MRVAGPVETSVRAAASRLAVLSRVLVVAGCTALLPLGGPAGAAAGVVGVLFAWQVVFVLLGRWPQARTAVDGVLLAAVLVVLPWLDPPHGHLELDDWVRPVASMCVGAAQIYTRPRDGAAYAVVAAAAMWAGSSITPSDDWNLRGAQALMLFWQAGLARFLIVLVSRGARRVDDLTAATAVVRREAELTAARRSDVEDHLAVLHDTVAATLTAASSRGVGGPELRRRALSDLSRLEPAPRSATFADLTTPPEDSALTVTVELITVELITAERVTAEREPPDGGRADSQGGERDGRGEQGGEVHDRVGAFGDGLAVDGGGADSPSGGPEGAGLGRAADGRVADDGAGIPAYAINALLAARNEALRNVERHAGTDRARVRVRVPAPGVVELDVIDEGRGFRPDEVRDGVHLGLRLSVEARMRRAGGSARVVSEPGRGTRVALRWPVR